MEETHAFTGSYVNAIRFGYNHENVNNNTSATALNPAAGNLALGVLRNRYASTININGLSSMPGGLGALLNDLYNWNSFQGYDDAFSEPREALH